MVASERFSEILARLAEPVFLARETGPNLVTLHTMERRSASRLGRRANEALEREGADARCRVVAHSPRALRRVRSLEALTKRFGQGRVIYDPTGFVGRSEAVSDCARRLRAAMGDQVKNIFLDTSRRTLYVIVSEKATTPANALKERGDLVTRAGAVMSAWQRTVDREFHLAVRIGAEPPRGVRLVSVDAQSVTQTIREQLARTGIVRGALALGTAALFGATMVVPAAAEGPAVRDTNGAITVRGGSYDLNDLGDGDAEGDLLGRATFPLGHSFGATAEAAVGTDSYYGIGGQLFWRDPAWATAGVFVSHDDTDGVDLTRYGVAADYYLDRFTLGGRVGGQDGDVGDGWFGRADVVFYINPNLLVQAGVEFEPDDAPSRDTVGRVGFEWQPALESSPGLSVFADGEWGDDYDHIRFGLNILLGADGVNLMTRHREYNHGSILAGRRGYDAEEYGGSIEITQVE